MTSEPPTRLFLLKHRLERDVSKRQHKEVSFSRAALWFKQYNAIYGNVSTLSRTHSSIIDKDYYIFLAQGTHFKPLALLGLSNNYMQDVSALYIIQQLCKFRD